MIKTIVAGLWMSATMLASGYGTTQYLAAQKRVGDDEPAFVGLDYETVNPVSIQPGEPRSVYAGVRFDF